MYTDIPRIEFQNVLTDDKIKLLANLVEEESSIMRVLEKEESDVLDTNICDLVENARYAVQELANLKEDLAQLAGTNKATIRQ